MDLADIYIQSLSLRWQSLAAIYYVTRQEAKIYLQLYIGKEAGSGSLIISEVEKCRKEDAMKFLCYLYTYACSTLQIYGYDNALDRIRAW